MKVSTPQFLKKCQELSALGLHFEFEQGMVVARGFADLGFEEFILLSPDRMASLFTGQVSSFDDSQKRHFFAVPSSDALVNRIVTEGYDILNLIFVEQRDWRLTVRNTLTEKEKSFTAKGLPEVLLFCLIAIAQNVGEISSGQKVINV